MSEQQLDITAARYDALASGVPLEQKTIYGQHGLASFDLEEPYVVVAVPKLKQKVLFCIPSYIVDQAKARWHNRYSPMEYIEKGYCNLNNPMQYTEKVKHYIEKVYLGLQPFLSQDTDEPKLKVIALLTALTADEQMGGKVIASLPMGEYVFDSFQKENCPDSPNDLLLKTCGKHPIQPKQSHSIFHSSLRRSTGEPAPSQLACHAALRRSIE